MGFWGLFVVLFCFGGIKNLVRKVQKGGPAELFTSPLFIFLVSICSGFSLTFPAIVLAIIFSNQKKKGRTVVRKQTNTVNPLPYQYSQTAYQQSAPVYPQQKYAQPQMQQQRTVSPTAFGLPSSPRKRKKIVQKFNKLYSLNLSDREIENIVGGSFMDAQWAREVCYMNQEFPTIHSWYATSNPWLKAYLSAFNDMNINPDFVTQEKIAHDSFELIFDDMLKDPKITVQQAIRDINFKYLTNFDEATFSLALRYMESKGKTYKLNYSPVVNSREEIDNLLDKYSQTNQGTPSH